MENGITATAQTGSNDAHAETGAEGLQPFGSSYFLISPLGEAYSVHLPGQVHLGSF